MLILSFSDMYVPRLLWKGLEAFGLLFLSITDHVCIFIFSEEQYFTDPPLQLVIFSHCFFCGLFQMKLGYSYSAIESY